MRCIYVSFEQFISWVLNATWLCMLTLDKPIPSKKNVIQGKAFLVALDARPHFKHRGQNITTCSACSSMCLIQRESPTMVGHSFLEYCVSRFVACTYPCYSYSHSSSLCHSPCVLMWSHSSVPIATVWRWTNLHCCSWSAAVALGQSDEPSLLRTLTLTIVSWKLVLSPCPSPWP